MLLKKILSTGVILLLLMSGETGSMNRRTNRSEWTFDNYLLEVQRNTSKQRNTTAIKNLTEMQSKFPNQETIMVNYLIGYNYYSINAFSSARKYLGNTFALYQTLTVEGEKIENE